MKCWCKHQGFLVVFYFPTIYRQFLDLQQYGWIYDCRCQHCYNNWKVLVESDKYIFHICYHINLSLDFSFGY